MVAEKPQKKAAYSRSQAAFNRCHRGRASDRICLPQRLLGFDGRHSARARSLGLILCGSELGLSVCELGGQLIDALAQLLSLSMTGSEGLIGEVSARLGHGRGAVGLFKLLA